MGSSLLVGSTGLTRPACSSSSEFAACRERRFFPQVKKIRQTDASRRKPSILELESREKVRMPTCQVCSLNRTNQIAHRTTKSAKMREKQNPAATILKGRGLTRSSERRARDVEYPYSRALVASDSLWCRYDAFAVRWERTQTGNSRLPRKGISLAPVC